MEPWVPGQWVLRTGVAVDTSGRIYLANPGANAVLKLAPLPD
jgi:hypothetical protein